MMTFQWGGADNSIYHIYKGMNYDDLTMGEGEADL